MRYDMAHLEQGQQSYRRTLAQHGIRQDFASLCETDVSALDGGAIVAMIARACDSSGALFDATDYLMDEGYVDRWLARLEELDNHARAAGSTQPEPTREIRRDYLASSYASPQGGNGPTFAPRWFEPGDEVLLANGELRKVEGVLEPGRRFTFRRKVSCPDRFFYALDHADEDGTIDVIPPEYVSVEFDAAEVRLARRSVGRRFYVSSDGSLYRCGLHDTHGEVLHPDGTRREVDGDLFRRLAVSLGCRRISQMEFERRRHAIKCPNTTPEEFAKNTLVLWEQFGYPPKRLLERQWYWNDDELRSAIMQADSPSRRARLQERRARTFHKGDLLVTDSGARYFVCFDSPQGEPTKDLSGMLYYGTVMALPYVETVAEPASDKVVSADDVAYVLPGYLDEEEVAEATNRYFKARDGETVSPSCEEGRRGAATCDDGGKPDKSDAVVPCMGEGSCPEDDSWAEDEDEWEDDFALPQWIWCVVGKVAGQANHDSLWRPDDDDACAFAADTTVYCLLPTDDLRQGKVVAIGWSRRDRRFVRALLPKERICDWHVQKVSSLRVIEAVYRDYLTDDLPGELYAPEWTNSDADLQHASEVVDYLTLDEEQLVRHEITAQAQWMDFCIRGLEEGAPRQHIRIYSVRQYEGEFYTLACRSWLGTYERSDSPDIWSLGLIACREVQNDFHGYEPVATNVAFLNAFKACRPYRWRPYYDLSGEGLAFPYEWHLRVGLFDPRSKEDRSFGTGGRGAAPENIGQLVKVLEGLGDFSLT